MLKFKRKLIKNKNNKMHTTNPVVQPLNPKFRYKRNEIGENKQPSTVSIQRRQWRRSLERKSFFDGGEGCMELIKNL
jgi:hypothetical protein